MLGTFANIFKIPDLRNKILFTIALLLIYRIGFHITVPGFNESKITQAAQSRDTDSPLGRAADPLQAVLHPAPHLLVQPGGLHRRCLVPARSGNGRRRSMAA